MSVRAYERYIDSGVEWLGEVPAGWQFTALKRFVDTARPITYGIVQAGPDVVGGIPYVRPADMDEERGVADERELLKTSADIASNYKRSALQTGDLVCSIGPSFGKVMVVPSTLDGANLTQGTARIAAASGVYTKFLFWVLRSRPSFSQWESSVGGATFRALNLEPLAATIICKPPIAEQTSIATFLDEETGKIDALVEDQRRLIELLKEKRQAVIAHAVTKGLDPTTPMKQSGVEWLGRIPAHWSVVPLKKIVRLRSGKGITAEDIEEEGAYPVFGGNGLREFTHSFTHEGDFVLVGRQGALCGNINYASGKFWASEHAIVASPQNGVRTLWLGELLRGMNLNQHSVAAAQPGLAVDAIGNLVCPWPPLDEQNRIADYLEVEMGRIDTLVAAAEAAIALLRERRSALISAAVTGKIDVRGLTAQAEVG